MLSRYLTLADVDICKAKEESLKKLMKEYSEVDTDQKMVQNIAEQAGRLHNRCRELDDAVKTLLASINKQVLR